MRSSAAVPSNRRVGAPTEVREHPGSEHALACPNCLRTETLQYVVAGKHYNAIRVVEVTNAGVTFPQVETTEQDADDPDVDADHMAAGIRCTACRWGFTGHAPAEKLVRAR